MILQEPSNAIIKIGPFFVGREGKNQVALRHPSFLFPADEIGGKDSGTILYVLCAATIEVAVALDKLERVKIRRPVLTTSFNHVEMCKQQDWFASAFATQSCDEVLLALIGTDDLHVSRGEPGRD